MDNHNQIRAHQPNELGTVRLVKIGQKDKVLQYVDHHELDEGQALKEVMRQ